MKNKRGIVLVTGASSGIGIAIAESFAAQGMDLILGARRVDRIKSLCEELSTKHGIRAEPIYLDVRNFDEIKNTLEGLPQDLREIDVLVNNAGLSLRADKVQEADISNFDTMTDTNFKGVYNMTRLVLPGMLERNKGHIINVGSIAGLEAYSTGSVYCASKAAVKVYTQATRLDVFGSDVRVTLIEPGMTSTEFMTVKMGEEKDHYAGVECLQAEDLANAILYCATVPAHVNICEMVVMPTHQASVAQVFRRKS